jgi:hypothetical protein
MNHVSVMQSTTQVPLNTTTDNLRHSLRRTSEALTAPYIPVDGNLRQDWRAPWPSPPVSPQRIAPEQLAFTHFPSIDGAQRTTLTAISSVQHLHVSTSFPAPHTSPRRTMAMSSMAADQGVDRRTMFTSLEVPEGPSTSYSLSSLGYGTSSTSLQSVSWPPLGLPSSTYSTSVGQTRISHSRHRHSPYIQVSAQLSYF